MRTWLQLKVGVYRLQPPLTITVSYFTKQRKQKSVVIPPESETFPELVPSLRKGPKSGTVSGIPHEVTRLDESFLVATGVERLEGDIQILVERFLEG